MTGGTGFGTKPAKWWKGSIIPCLILALFGASVLCETGSVLWRHFAASAITLPRYAAAGAAIVLFLLLLVICNVKSRQQAGEPSGREDAERRQVKLGRVKSVDGLRGVLALIIALFHFGQNYGIGNTFHRGWMAVEVFFLLSGFLLTNKLENDGGG